MLKICFGIKDLKLLYVKSLRVLLAFLVSKSTRLRMQKFLPDLYFNIRGKLGVKLN